MARHEIEYPSQMGTLRVIVDDGIALLSQGSRRMRLPYGWYAEMPGCILDAIDDGESWCVNPPDDSLRRAGAFLERKGGTMLLWGRGSMVSARDGVEVDWRIELPVSTWRDVAADLTDITDGRMPPIRAFPVSGVLAHERSITEALTRPRVLPV